MALLCLSGMNFDSHHSCLLQQMPRSTVTEVLLFHGQKRILGESTMREFSLNTRLGHKEPGHQFTETGVMVKRRSWMCLLSL